MHRHVAFWSDCAFCIHVQLCVKWLESLTVWLQGEVNWRRKVAWKCANISICRLRLVVLLTFIQKGAMSRHSLLKKSKKQTKKQKRKEAGLWCISYFCQTFQPVHDVSDKDWWAQSGSTQSCFYIFQALTLHKQDQLSSQKLLWVYSTPPPPPPTPIPLSLSYR